MSLSFEIATQIPLVQPHSHVSFFVVCRRSTLVAADIAAAFYGDWNVCLAAGYVSEFCPSHSEIL